MLATFSLPVDASATTQPIPGVPATTQPNSDVPTTKLESARDVARASAKHALATEFAQWNEGRVSAAQFQRDVSLFLAQYGPATFASKRLLAPMVPSTLSASSLSVYQYAEGSSSQFCSAGTTCYCGPSTGVSILAYLQGTSHDGETLFAGGSSWQGQVGLAGNFGSGVPPPAPQPPYSRKYLETNYFGGETPWLAVAGEYPMSRSFNWWVSGSYSGFPNYANYRPTSVTDYQNLLKGDISTGYPLAGDVEEIAYSVHLWGHPTNLEIQHWIPLYGYGSSPATTSYVDPVAGSTLSWAPAVNPYNSGFASSDMYTLVTDAGPHGGPYGIVW
jgi:hypothetical protein